MFTYNEPHEDDRDWIRSKLDATTEDDDVIARVVTDENIASWMEHCEDDKVTCAYHIAGQLVLAYGKEFTSFGQAAGSRFSYRDRTKVYAELQRTLISEGAMPYVSQGMPSIGDIERGATDVNDWKDVVGLPALGEDQPPRDFQGYLI